MDSIHNQVELDMDLSLIDTYAKWISWKRKKEKELLRVIKEDSDFQKFMEQNPFSHFFSSYFWTEIGEYFEKTFMKIVHPEFQPSPPWEVNYDWILWDKKIEVKTTRATFAWNKSKNEVEWSDSLIKLWKQKPKDVQIGNCWFRQIKPKEFDYLYWFVIFADKIKIYVIKPEQIISMDERDRGKDWIPYSTQHLEGDKWTGQIWVYNVLKYKPEDKDWETGTFYWTLYFKKNTMFFDYYDKWSDKLSTREILILKS